MAQSKRGGRATQTDDRISVGGCPPAFRKRRTPLFLFMRLEEPRFAAKPVPA